jgi:iron complex outermembrane receptor protein
LDVYFGRKEHNYYLPPAESTIITSFKPKQGQRLYPSFQFAVTYTPVEDHILRVSYARANKSPSMVDSFYSAPSQISLVAGNNAVDLLTLDTVELGYRTRFNRQIDMSVEVFGNYARDFGNSFIKGFDTDGRIIVQYDNISLKAWQLGVTISSGFTTPRFQGRVFATVQQTRLEDLDPNTFRTYDPTYINRENLINAKHEGTPDIFGGFYLNYQPVEAWNINVNAYYFSRHTQIHGDLPVGNIFNMDYTISGRVDIQQSFLLNVKVSYNFWNGLTAFVNVRNLFNINQAQFAWGDANHILCFIGLEYEL